MYSKRPTLREYQIDLVKAIDNTTENTCIQSDTGTGKSVVLMDYALRSVENGFNVLIIVPTIELVANLEKYVKEFAPIIHRLFYGVINSKYKFQDGKKLYIGTYGSIAKYHKVIKPDIVIHDECFLQGTLIDGKPIESYKIGDEINSWCKQTGEIKKQKITHIFKNPVIAENMMTIKFNNGVELTCTKNHPIWSVNDHAFKKAERFQQSSREKVYSLRDDCSNIPQQSSLLRMWHKLLHDSEMHSERYSETWQQSVLFGKLSEKMVKTGMPKLHRRSNPCKTESSLSRITQTFRSVYDGICCKFGLQERKLRHRHSFSASKNSDRNRWLFTSEQNKESDGHQTGRILDIIGVDSITFYTSADRKRFSGCYTYNFEVNEFNTYFAENILVHNCHHIRAKTWEQHIEYWYDKKHIGFTATPLRYDGKSLRKHFPKLVCSKTTEWFIENEFLSKYKCYTDPQSVKFVSEIRKDELDKQQTLWDNYDLVANAYQTWKRLAYGEQTIIFCTGEHHAEQVREQYGDIARVITGKTPNRDKILAGFDNKEFPVLININILTEGVDVKECTTIQLLRKTYSLSLYRQAIGRGLRIDKNNPNKILKILDHAGNIDEHGEPAIEIDWEDLYYSAEQADKLQNFNKDELAYTCAACTAPIAKLGEIRGQQMIICPYCCHANVIQALKASQIKQLNIAEEIELIEFVTPIADQQLKKILRSNKMSHQVKIQAILKVKKASETQKINALMDLGIDQRLAINYVMCA